MLTIRKATPADAEALHDLYTHHLTTRPPADPQDLDRWRALLRELERDPGYHLLVGAVGGAVVSSVTVIVIRNLTNGLRPYAVIENVVTRADHRGHGYATALMERACGIARDAGCYKVMLMTGSKRESTLRFYERCGFDRGEKTAFIRRFTDPR